MIDDIKKIVEQIDETYDPLISMAFIEPGSRAEAREFTRTKRIPQIEVADIKAFEKKCEIDDTLKVVRKLLISVRDDLHKFMQGDEPQRVWSRESVQRHLTKKAES